jgi:hypothetical protein
MEDDPTRPRQTSFEIRDDVIEKIMYGLAEGIRSGLPENWGFSLFLFENHPQTDTDTSNVMLFYVSSLAVPDAVQLIKTWCNRQTQ